LAKGGSKQREAKYKRKKKITWGDAFKEMKTHLGGGRPVIKKKNYPGSTPGVPNDESSCWGVYKGTGGERNERVGDRGGVTKFRKKLFEKGGLQLAKKKNRTIIERGANTQDGGKTRRARRGDWEGFGKISTEALSPWDDRLHPE